jgi:hypothetical protein
VPEIVPAQVDASHLLPVPVDSLFSAESRCDAVRQQLQRFPRRLNRRLVLAVRAAEDECVGCQTRPPFENRRKPSLRVERNPAVLLVLRRGARDADLTRVPVDALFWIKSISPRRQQSSSAPMMRSCSISPTYWCGAVFITPSAVSSSRFSSSRERRRSRIVSAFLFIRTPTG